MNLIYLQNEEMFLISFGESEITDSKDYYVINEIAFDTFKGVL